MRFLDDEALASLQAAVGGPGPGDVIDERFELREEIGAGGMGTVFAAWDRQLEREVALKVLREDGAHDAERFEREADALARVSHPAVVGYIARGRTPRARYLAMERLVGLTLADRLEAGPLAISDVMALGCRLAGGLAAVHEAALAHRDVKPTNVFLVGGRPGDARLLDFGLARGADRLTATGALVGTPGYMAPEQVRGDDDVGSAADVFSLGCVLYECVSGRAAFAAASPERLFAAILLHEPEPLVATDMPPELGSLVTRLLQKDPVRRPTAAHVEEQLRALQTERPTEPDAAIDACEELAPGTIINDKYVVGRALGRGGMGVVLEAKHRQLGTRVALKIMRGRRSAADEARFLREAQAAARIESEHALRVLDVARMPDGAPYLVMEHLRGVDLARRLRSGGPLPLEEAVGAVLEASIAIAEAHAMGIVHRDLKPSNLFLTTRRDGTPLIKVLDFGISKITRPLDGASEGDVSITSPTAVMGSAAYMSPEQLRNSKDVDARTDIWALGVVLHELLTGKLPFSGDSPAAVGARIAVEHPVRLCDALPSAPEALEAVILRCLEKRPEQRYPSLGAFAADLAPFAAPRQRSAAQRIARVLAGGVEQASAPDPGAAAHATDRAWDASTTAAPRRRSLMAAAAVALVLAAAAGFALDPPRAANREHTALGADAHSARRVATPPPGEVVEPASTPPEEASAAAPPPSGRGARVPTEVSASAAPKPPPVVDVRDPALEDR